MHGIPCAPGRKAYLLVGREVGALCVERLAVFVSYIQLSYAFRSFVQERLSSESGFLFGSSYGFVLGETQILANLRSSWDSHHVGFL